jgi:hypothetical protein
MHSVSSHNSIILIFGAPLFITDVYSQLPPKKRKAHDLYFPPTIWVIETTIVTCVGHVTPTGDKTSYFHLNLHDRGIWWNNLRERDHLEELAIDRGVILKWIFKEGEWGMDWICLAQDRDRQGAIVSAVMNLRVP